MPEEHGFYERRVRDLIKPTGIRIDGPNPWDPQIRVREFGISREKLFYRMISQKSLGLAETYMLGWWECADLKGLYERTLLHADISPQSFAAMAIWAQDLVLNRQAKHRMRKLMDRHYDLPYEMYLAQLGPTGLYTCAYFTNGNTDVNEAQRAKIRMDVAKLRLKPGMTVIDIGCGWGGTAALLFEFCPGIRYIGLSLSEEQIRVARERFPGNTAAKFICTDYRDYKGTADCVISLGMAEHVGVKNLRTYFTKVRSFLNPGGRALIHFMHAIVPSKNDAFIETYVFPNSQLPSMDEVERAIKGLFLIQDRHEMGRMYSPTLDYWRQNFIDWWATLTAEQKADLFGTIPYPWKDLPLNTHDPECTPFPIRLRRAERFYRMWEGPYLSGCSAASSTQNFTLYQHLLVLQEEGLKLEEPVR